MLHNATITRIDKYTGPDASGNPTYQIGSTIRLRGTFIRVGVLFQDSASSHQQAHPNVGRLLVDLADLSSAEAITMNDRITVTPDGRPKRRYIVNYVWDRVGTVYHPGHLELDLRDEDQPPKLPGVP